MTDSTRAFLASLLEDDSSESADWDPSALADWPNIVPGTSATDSPAGSPAAAFDRAP